MNRGVGLFHLGVPCQLLMVWVFLVLSLILVGTNTWAQGFVPMPGATPRGGAFAPFGTLDTTPANPLGMPGSPVGGVRQSGSVLLSNATFRGLLPDIPNLRVGYLYTFGGIERQGFLTVDYTLPLPVNNQDVVFAETHGQFEDVPDLLSGSRDPNLQVLVGGGYRKRLPRNVMLGLNGFYNVARLSGDWYSSGIAGIEMAAVSAGDSLILLNATYYGNIFADTAGPFTAYREGSGDYKVQVAYEQAIFNRAFDLRMRGGGYRLDRDGYVHGWNAGADLTTRNKMLTLRYDTGHDRIYETYHSVGVHLTVGFRAERLLAGRNPFTRL